jgi:hypothetical protein
MLFKTIKDHVFHLLRVEGWWSKTVNISNKLRDGNKTISPWSAYILNPPLVSELSRRQMTINDKWNGIIRTRNTIVTCRYRESYDHGRTFCSMRTVFCRRPRVIVRSFSKLCERQPVAPRSLYSSATTVTVN